MIAARVLSYGAMRVPLSHLTKRFPRPHLPQSRAPATHVLSHVARGEEKEEHDTISSTAVLEQQMGLDGLIVAYYERSTSSVIGGVSIGAVAALHVAALGAVCVGPPPGALELSLFATSYTLRMFGITAGYHRYFAHKSFSCGRGMQLMLGVLGAAAWQRGPLWWAAHHIEVEAHAAHATPHLRHSRRSRC